jgi:hypothetical protein
MNYKQLISDFADGTLDPKRVSLQMDNDSCGLTVYDDHMEDEQIDKEQESLEKIYGGDGGGECDIMEILEAAGIPAHWC